MRSTPVLLVFIIALLIACAPALSATTICVDDDAVGDPGPGNPGVSDPLEDGSAAHPFDAIQEGIDAAVAGDTVLVKDGTYTGTGNREIDLGGKAITVTSENGAETCIIDCQGAGRGFYFHSGETAASVVDGLTITNGSADYGGGIYCENSGPTIAHCTISGNAASSDGGGIYCSSSSSMTITDCTISGNAATDDGGGISDWSEGTITITGCTISGNTAHSGGGCCLECGKFTVSHCTIIGNAAVVYGGGISIESPDDWSVSNCTVSGNEAKNGGGIYCFCTCAELVTNCVIRDNTATGSGGGICTTDSPPIFLNCTLTGNSAGSAGGGAYCAYEFGPSFENCVLWGNAAPSGHELAVSGDSPMEVHVAYSAVQGGAEEVYVSDPEMLVYSPGNIEDDPLLLADGHVAAGSPCIDRCPTGPTDDLDGLPRPVDIPGMGNDGIDTYDMGAFEVQDTDADGMPDEWEIDNGLDPNNPGDAWQNVDGDLLLNVEEYLFGSDPNDADSPVFVYVDDDNAGDPAQDGTLAHPYESIQAAIDAAAGPAVIEVLAGTYDELVVMASDVWVIGAGAGAATIAPSLSGSVVSFLDVSNARLAGVTIRPQPASNAVRVLDASVTVRHCLVAGGWTGLSINGSGAACIIACAVVDNGNNGVWASGTTVVELANCTIANNGYRGAYVHGTAPAVVTNTIVYGNADDLDVGGSTPITVSCCDIGDGDYAGTNGNISADPLFVAGPLHAYYLSQLAAGQGAESPCVDAGSDAADALGMGHLCTRTDGLCDTGVVDMGYHVRPSTEIYVDDDAAGDPGPGNPGVSDPLEDGSAAHPFDAIQEGIDAAVAGDTVLVKDGTYTGSGNRSLDLGGKAITLRSESGAGATIIDCGTAQLGFIFQSGETAATVVYGFTIAGGNVTCKLGSSPTIMNCTISGSPACGVYCLSGSRPWIDSCWIGGSAASGICCTDSGPTIAHCTISGNTAHSGGGVYCALADVTMTHCVISGNAAAYSGGGISIAYGSSDLSISNCTIAGNEARYGGGIYCYSTFDALVVNCIIGDNTATDYGGGIYADTSAPTVLNCTLTGNSAGLAGGGANCAYDFGPSFENCILWGNAAPLGHELAVGGGIYPETHVAYSAVQGGASEAYVSPSDALSYGPGNIQDDPLLRPDGHVAAGSPCIDRCPTGPTDDLDGLPRPVDIVGVGNDGTDTYDMGAYEYADTDGDGLPDWWELKHFGSTTGAGAGADEEPDGLTNLEEYGYGADPFNADTDGDGRTDGQEVADGTNPVNPDNAQKTYYVNGDPAVGNDAYDGCAPVYDGVHGPKRTIQAGIDATVTGWHYTVLVAPWTYAGSGNRSLDLGGKAITLRSESGAGATIIDCGTAQLGFIFQSGETAATVVYGFTIAGGNVTCKLGSSPTIMNCTISGSPACGVYCLSGSDPWIDSCWIGGSAASGIYCQVSDPTITDCTITENDEEGIECSNSSAVIARCTITDNGSSGVYYSGEGPTIANCTIARNSSWRGGGVYCDGGDATITNCVIMDNTAELGGGLYGVNHYSLTVTNCTIVGNEASELGGAICCEYAFEATLTNCILWANVAPDGHEIALTEEWIGYPVYDYYASSLTARYSDIEGDASEVYAEPHCTLDIDGTCIDTDPLLMPDGHVTAGSPCIDRCPTGPADDLDGVPRPVEVMGVGNDGTDTYDMGAFEFGDADADGMPDDWELDNGLDPNDPGDARHDADGDLLLNVEEYALGSDPNDAASPASLYVDDDNAGDPMQDGSAVHPYEAIQPAVDAAAAPAVVRVLAGTYNEAVVMRTGVYLVGSGAARTTIDSLNAGEAVLCNGTSEVLVAGFTLKSGPTYTALRSAYSTTVVRDCVATASRSGFGAGQTGTLLLCNCLAYDNDRNGVWQSEGAALSVRHATIADNGHRGDSSTRDNGLVRWGTATVTVTDSILYGNVDDLDGSRFTIRDCCIGDGDYAGVEGNIAADPLFVSGPLHACYLSQVAAGQAVTSPCVDAGSDTAAALGLDGLTTRIDGGRDEGVVDMGYHAAPAPFITSIARSGDDVVVEWNGLAGMPYVLEWTDEWWSEAATWNEVSVGAVETWTDVGVLAGTPAGTKRWYRVREDAAPPAPSATVEASSGSASTGKGATAAGSTRGGKRAPAAPVRGSSTGPVRPGPNVREGGNVRGGVGNASRN